MISSWKIINPALKRFSNIFETLTGISGDRQIFVEIFGSNLFQESSVKRSQKNRRFASLLNKKLPRFVRNIFEEFSKITIKKSRFAKKPSWQKIIDPCPRFEQRFDAMRIAAGTKTPHKQRRPHPPRSSPLSQLYMNLFRFQTGIHL